MTHVTDTALRRSPAQRVCRRRAARDLAVLAYHGVDSAEQLGRQLDLLVDVACPVSLEQVVNALDGGLPLPPRAVLVTFDDGHPSVLRDGVAALVPRRIPAVAFVIPGLVASGHAFWWVVAERLHAAGARAPGAPASAAGLVRWLKDLPDTRRQEVLVELREQAPEVDLADEQLDVEGLRRLRGAGVDIGNHTWTHPCLDHCTDAQVETQVVRAHTWLTEALGEPPRSFAYPNGNHDARAERLLERLGYRTGFLFDHRLSPRPALAEHPLRISRLRVGTSTSLDRFSIILSGLHPVLHHARGRR